MKLIVLRIKLRNVTNLMWTFSMTPSWLQNAKLYHWLNMIVMVLEYLWFETSKFTFLSKPVYPVKTATWSWCGTSLSVKDQSLRLLM